jgi:hypothetical protein
VLRQRWSRGITLSRFQIDLCYFGPCE